MELKKSAEGHTYVTLYKTEVRREDFYHGRGIEVYIEPERFNIFAWTAGDVVKVTNLSSGQLVEGVVNPDGSITVY